MLATYISNNLNKASWNIYIGKNHAILIKTLVPQQVDIFGIFKLNTVSTIREIAMIFGTDIHGI